MRVKLTDQRVKSAPPAPKGKRTYLWDDTKRGLALRITDTGAKSWVVIRRPKGQDKVVRVTLGAYPAVSLARARELAKPVLDDLEEGTDPNAKRAAEAAATARLKEGLVENALTDYEDSALGDLRTAEKIKRMFSNHVRPRWKGRHLYDLRRLDVLKLRDDMAKNNGRVIADRTLESLNAFFKWYSNRDEEFRSPMPPIWRLVKRADLMRSRALSDSEIRALWAACDAVVPAMYGTLVKLLLITGQRLDDWRAAKWDELTDTALLIPAGRYKAKKDQAVPLGEAARALVATLPRTGAYLFQLREGPFSNLSKAKKRLDAAMLAKLRETEPEAELPNFRLHDLRRTARSLLSRAGIDRSVAERLIGHSVGDHVERTYDTYGYWREREAAAKALADIVARIVAGTEAEIIEIGAKRRSVAGGTGKAAHPSGTSTRSA